MVGTLLLVGWLATAQTAPEVGPPPPPVETPTAAPEVGPPAPEAAVTTEKPIAKKPPREPSRLPTPLGFVGLIGLGGAGAVVLMGLAVSAVGTLLILQGRQQQASADSLAGDTSTLAQQERVARSQAARESFDRSRILVPLGGAVTLTGLVGTAVAALVVMLDEILFVPARKSETPVWDIVGPLLGYREPIPGWPELPLPKVPYIFTRPEPKKPAAKPAPVEPPPAEAPAPDVKPEPAPPPAAPSEEPVAP